MGRSLLFTEFRKRVIIWGGGSIVLAGLSTLMLSCFDLYGSSSMHITMSNFLLPLPFSCRGYNIGVRLIDEFLAKSNVSRCVDFKETAEVIAKVEANHSLAFPFYCKYSFFSNDLGFKLVMICYGL